jgi:hypothetical protein
LPRLGFWALRARPKTSRQHDTIPASETTATSTQAPFRPAGLHERRGGLRFRINSPSIRYVDALSLCSSSFSSTAAQQHSTSHIATLQHEHEHEHERLAASAIARQLQPLSDQPLWGRVNSNSPTWRSHARCRLETPLLPAFPLPLTGLRPLIPQKGSPQSAAEEGGGPISP